jgi:hypothetical protein
MGRTALFRRELDDHPDRPPEISFLVRPTSREFDRFVECLDKYLSQNISTQFFRSEIDSKESDGKQKGSIQMLEEWLKRSVRTSDESVYDGIVGPFREVRALRQSPAHRIERDRFDQEYLKTQREVAEKVYGAVRTLRLLVQNHPSAASYAVPDWLQTPSFFMY